MYYPGKSIVSALLFSLSFAASAALPPDNPVPGGVAVVGLGIEFPEGSLAQFGKREVMVRSQDGEWFAIVGLSFDTSPGKYIVTLHTPPDTLTNRPFRVNPLPSTTAQRTISLPRLLENLDLSTSKRRASELAARGVRNEDASRLNPEFSFRQIVNAGSFIPYGLVLRGKEHPTVVEHTCITYITKVDEVVNSPAAAVVESVSLDESAGISIVLNHGDGLKSVITYLNDTILKVGDRIEKGDLVGTTQHLAEIQAGRVDWHLFLNGNPIDPSQFAFSS